MAVDEIVISYAITAIAMGAGKPETRADIEETTNLRKITIDELLTKALAECLAQGVEKEDIHESWFT